MGSERVRHDWVTLYILYTLYFNVKLLLKYIMCACKLSRFSSVQFSRSVVSDSLRPHESQHTRPPCSSPTPGVYSNSCPSSQSCHPAISSSVVPFSSCPKSLPASGSFPMSQLFTWGGQSTGVSASSSVLPMNTRDWSPLGWTSWISLLQSCPTLCDPIDHSLNHLINWSFPESQKFPLADFLSLPSTLTSNTVYVLSCSVQHFYTCLLLLF